jgi:VanZ family protein
VAATIYIESDHGVVPGPDLPNFDKVAHFFVYGLFATLLFRALAESGPRVRRAAPWIALAIASLYGVTDEWHQSFTPGRSVDVLDWIADTAGVSLALLCYVRWRLYRQFLEFGIAGATPRPSSLPAKISP